MRSDAPTLMRVGLTLNSSARSAVVAVKEPMMARQAMNRVNWYT